MKLNTMQLFTNLRRYILGTSIGFLLTIGTVTATQPIPFSSLVKEVRNASTRRRLVLDEKIDEAIVWYKDSEKRLPIVEMDFKYSNLKSIWKLMSKGEKYNYLLKNKDYFTKNQIPYCGRCVFKKKSLTFGCGACKSVKYDINKRCAVCVEDKKSCNRCTHEFRESEVSLVPTRGINNIKGGTWKYMTNLIENQQARVLSEINGLVQGDIVTVNKITDKDNVEVYCRREQSLKIVKESDLDATSMMPGRNNPVIEKLTGNNTAIVIFGAGWHTLNGFKSKANGEGNSPRGVSKENDTVSFTTLQNMISDIKNAKSFVDNPKKGTIFDKRQNQVKFTNARDNVVRWLESLAGKPQKCQITCLRNIKSYETRDSEHPVLMKPAWAAKVISNENTRQGARVKFCIDFGTGKVAVTDPNGCQIKALSHDDYFLENDGTYNEDFQIEEYIEKILKVLRRRDPEFQFGEVVARFTGRHRYIQEKSDMSEDEYYKKHRTYDFINALELSGIKSEILPQNDEAKFGSTHCLDITRLYVPQNIERLKIIEGGKGSFQIVDFVLEQKVIEEIVVVNPTENDQDQDVKLSDTEKHLKVLQKLVADKNHELIALMKNKDLANATYALQEDDKDHLLKLYKKGARGKLRKLIKRHTNGM